MADQLKVTLTIRKRWFFWPAMLSMVALGRLGILKDAEAAGKWLADNALTFEVKQAVGA